MKKSHVLFARKRSLKLVKSTELHCITLGLSGSHYKLVCTTWCPEHAESRRDFIHVSSQGQVKIINSSICKW